MMILQKIALVFTIIGAIVWGIYGLFDVNIVAKLFANVNILEKAVYVVVGCHVCLSLLKSGGSEVLDYLQAIL